MEKTEHSQIVIAEGSAETFTTVPVTVRVLEAGSNTDNRIGAVEIIIPPHTEQTPLHFYNMHNKTFLATKGRVRFSTGDTHHDLSAGGYMVAPVKAHHIFSNPFDETAVFFNTFTLAYYVNYLRKVDKLTSEGKLTLPSVIAVMARYATEPVENAQKDGKK